MCHSHWKIGTNNSMTQQLRQAKIGPNHRECVLSRRRIAPAHSQERAWTHSERITKLFSTSVWRGSAQIAKCPSICVEEVRSKTQWGSVLPKCMVSLSMISCIAPPKSLPTTIHASFYRKMTTSLFSTEVDIPLKWDVQVTMYWNWEWNQASRTICVRWLWTQKSLQHHWLSLQRFTREWNLAMMLKFYDLFFDA